MDQPGWARCPQCGLNQSVPEDHRCRRCNQDLRAPAPAGGGPGRPGRRSFTINISIFIGIAAIVGLIVARIYFYDSIRRAIFTLPVDGVYADRVHQFTVELPEGFLALRWPGLGMKGAVAGFIDGNLDTPAVTALVWVDQVDYLDFDPLVEDIPSQTVSRIREEFEDELKRKWFSQGVTESNFRIEKVSWSGRDGWRMNADLTWKDITMHSLAYMGWVEDRTVFVLFYTRGTSYDVSQQSIVNMIIESFEYY